MKTYQEVIERAGSRIYGAYMSGSYDYYNVVPSTEIAFIFEKTTDEVESDCDKVFKSILEGHLSRYHSKGN
jgi:hypothetical protein